MQSAEIELKFPIPDIGVLQSRLRALGFHLDTPRTFESNNLYDTSTRSLRQAAQILRLRQYGPIWTLTHKRHPENEDPTSRYKVRIETETTVEDGPALEEIFHQLGYNAVFRYEKYRTEWSPAELGHPGCLVIDETPIGTWGELEGPTSWIDSTLDALSIDPATCTTDSYGKLFLGWKERTGSPAENLTFAEIEASAPLRV
jgi:adenylate cyclase class 2